MFFFFADNKIHFVSFQNSISFDRYIGRNDSTGTYMSLLEVGLPSGFYADEDALKNAVKEDKHLEKYEIAQRTLFLYLNTVRRSLKLSFLRN